MFIKYSYNDSIMLQAKDALTTLGRIPENNPVNPCSFIICFIIRIVED